MRILTITGDKRFGLGHERYELQRAAVEELAAVYWGRGALFPKLPRGPFDVVTAQDPLWRGLFGWYAAKRLGAKLNVQVHMDLESLGAPRRMLARFVLRRADSVRAVSQKIKDQVGKSHAKARVGILPVFIDLERFRAIKLQPHEGKIVLWVGRFEPEKNPLLALEVFKKIIAQGIDAKLIMLGAGSLKPALKNTAHGFPVQFPGWHDPLPYLAEADAVLSTSRHESWGASMVEALAAGVPVVALDVGVAREAGAIVTSRDGLARAVAEALAAGVRGQLGLQVLSKDEWVRRWRDTLL